MKVAFGRETEYWNNLWEGEEAVPALLPYTKAASPSAPQMRTVTTMLSKGASERIVQMSRGSALASFMLLWTGVQVLLFKYTSSRRILLGMPAVKLQKESRQPVSPLVLLNGELGADSTFKIVLNEAKTSAAEAIKHQNLPFRLMAERLDLEYTDGLPVLSTMVAMKQLHPDADVMGSAVVDAFFEFDLDGETLRVDLSYNENLYHEAFMKQVLRHLDRILSVGLVELELSLGQLDILTEEERAQLQGFNQTTSEYADDSTIHGLIEEQVQLRPEHPAVVFEGNQLTYAELNERANRLARTLRARGVTPDQPVGLMLERSLEMIVGLLAVLKAGGAYVPIDPEYPEERIRFMLEDSGAQVLLLQSHLQERISFAGTVIAVDDEQAYSEDGTNLESAAGADHLGYIIYTSGTTGKPKGVMVPHRGLCSLKLMFADTLGITSEDRIVQFASSSFDASCWEIYKALFFGATLFIPASSTILDTSVFESYMHENGITAAI